MFNEVPMENHCVEQYQHTLRSQTYASGGKTKKCTCLLYAPVSGDSFTVTSQAQVLVFVDAFIMLAVGMELCLDS